MSIAHGDPEAQNSLEEGLVTSPLHQQHGWVKVMVVIGRALTIAETSDIKVTSQDDLLKFVLC